MKSLPGDPLRDDQLALMSNAVFDVPPLTRGVFCLFAFIGVAIIAVESLTPRTETLVEIDKIVHFTGYAILSGAFVLALQKRILPLGLVLTAVLGAVIEFFQLFTGREVELDDLLANLVGIAVGSTLGLIARKIWANISREMARSRTQQRLRTYEPGEIVFREGESARSFFVLKSGRLQGCKAISEEPFELSPGSIAGLIGALQASKHFTTIRALETSVLYEMTLDELLEEAGDKQAPVRVVLTDMAETIRTLVENASKASSDTTVRPPTERKTTCRS